MTSRPQEKTTPRQPRPSELVRDEKRPQLPQRDPPDEIFEEKGPAGGYGGAGCDEDEP